MSEMTLAEFLTARLDEDAVGAALCILDGDDDSDGSWFALAGSDNAAPAAEAVVRRWHPARILAEVGAKRHIVSFCEAVSIPGSTGSPPLHGFTYVGVTVLRQMAMPYADHPDYREEWRGLH